VFYSSNACKNQNLKNCFKIVVKYWLFATKWNINLWKISFMCTYSKLRYGHFKVRLLLRIVFYSSNKFKNENLKNCFKMVVKYWLFDTKWNINLWENSIMCTSPKLRYGHFKVWQLLYILFYCCNACKNQNLKNCFKIVVYHWLFVV